MQTGGRQRGGFTLIEMMLVMMIIGIMLLILIPAVTPRSLGRLATVRIMDSLKNELEAYYAVYGAYPPSDHGSMSGSQCLYYFLTGPRGRGWQRNSQDGGVSATKTWEPSTFNAEWIGQIGSGPKFFLDGYGDGTRALLYYRANRTKVSYNQVYKAGDNSGPGDYGWDFSGEWKRMIVDPATGSSNRPYNGKSYILISAGKDRVFGFDGADSIDDDMNFKRRKKDD